MKRPFCILVVLFACVLSFACEGLSPRGAARPSTQPARIKNVIYVIGDGMEFQHAGLLVELFRLFGRLNLRSHKRSPTNINTIREIMTNKTCTLLSRVIK